MRKEKDTTSNPLTDFLDDMIVVGLDKSAESKLRKSLEKELTFDKIFERPGFRSDIRKSVAKARKKASA